MSEWHRFWEPETAWGSARLTLAVVALLGMAWYAWFAMVDQDSLGMVLMAVSHLAGLALVAATWWDRARGRSKREAS